MEEQSKSKDLDIRFFHANINCFPCICNDHQ